MLYSGKIEVAGVREEHPTIFSPLDIVAICLAGMPAINIALAPLCLSLCIPAAPRALGEARGRAHLSPSKVTP